MQLGFMHRAYLVVANLTLMALSVQGQPSAPSVRTDRAVYAPPQPAPTLPEAGGTFVDPTFGMTILRVTDAADGKENHNAYSYWPSFNRDSSRFFIWSGGKAVLYRFDPDAFRIVGKETLWGGKPPSGSTPGWEDAIWSGVDADVLYCHEGLNLWRYDVATKQYTLVKNFSNLARAAHIRQMSKSLDDSVFGFSLQDKKWNVIGYLVWRRDSDKVLLEQYADGLDEIQVDKSGRFCVIKTGRQGKGAIEARVADLATGKIDDLTDNAPDFAPGHSDNGHGFVMGADNWRNCLTVRRLATPHNHAVALDLKNDWSQDFHVSLLADDEQWALVSFYVGNRLESSGVFRDEIVQVATDGSQRVRRLAHHRSAVRDYWDSPRANISRDGRFVVFTSNWNGTGQRDVFILQVPDVRAASDSGKGEPGYRQ